MYDIIIILNDECIIRMPGEEIALFLRKKAKDWKTYIKSIEAASLQVGNRPTERLHFLNIEKETLQKVIEASQYVIRELNRIIDTVYENLIKDDHSHKNI